MTFPGNSLLQYQQDPIALNDPRLYRVMLDQAGQPAGMEGDLAVPTGPLETIPPPPGAAAAREAMSDDADQGSQSSGQPSESSQAADVDSAAAKQREPATEAGSGR